MYSVILMAAMTSAPAEPQGIIFNRSGCSGVSVRANVRATVSSAGARVRAVVASRPTPIRNLASAVADRQPVRGFFGRVFARGGCGGSYASAGGVSASINVQAGSMPMPAAEAPSRAVPGEVNASGLLTRLAIRSNLREALGQTHEMTALSAKQKSIAARAATDRRVFNLAVEHVHDSLGKQIGVRAVGDWLKVIIDNLPAILDAIERIIKLFGSSHWFTLENYASTFENNGQEVFDREFMLAA